MVKKEDKEEIVEDAPKTAAPVEKASKSVMLEFIESRIAQAERNLIRNNGMAQHDFDSLFKYHKLKEIYGGK